MSNAEKCKAYYHANKEKRVEANRKHYEENRERILARRRQLRLNKTRPWLRERAESRREEALRLVMEAVRSPYTKVNDGGDLMPNAHEVYSEDQPPEGVVWIASRPGKILVGSSQYSWEPWVDAVIEAEDRVYLLVQQGHAGARSVVDLHYEVAFTCDNCGLWSAVGKVYKTDRWSQSYEHGALFDAKTCDPQATHKLFGKAFDPESAFDRESQPDYGDDLRETQRRGKSATATKKRRG